MWVSAIVSAFIDNIPFVTAMVGGELDVLAYFQHSAQCKQIPVIVELADAPDVCIDLKPIVFALAFGGCLGGELHANIIPTVCSLPPPPPPFFLSTSPFLPHLYLKGGEVEVSGGETEDINGVGWWKGMREFETNKWDG